MILILADDLGYGDLSCYGSNEIETPHIDGLADDGIKLGNFYASSAVCTPSRAGLLSGKFPIRYHITRHFTDITDSHLPVSETNLPFMFKNAGYQCAHIGKWHLGGLQEHEFNARMQGNEDEDPGPLEHGFDHYLAFIEDTIRGALHNEKLLYREGGKYLVRNDRRIEPNEKHWTEIKVDETISLIEEYNKTNALFFINLWLDLPHTPYEPAPEPFLSKYKKRGMDEPQANYCSMVSFMDHGIGKIIRLLEELDIRDNTVVIFFSDNGPSYIGSTGYFKGGKADLHEGGLHVPFIISWPARLKQDVIRNDLVATSVDLLPTLADIAGIDPTDYSFDGMSLMPFLTGEKEFGGRPPIFFQLDLYTWYPQPGEKPKPYATSGLIDGKYKLLLDSIEPVALYDIKSDPSEMENLLDKNKDVVESMRDKAIEILDAPRDRSGRKESCHLSALDL